MTRTTYIHTTKNIAVNRSAIYITPFLRVRVHPSLYFFVYTSSLSSLEIMLLAAISHISLCNDLRAACMVEQLRASFVASANQDYVVKPYGLDYFQAMIASIRHIYHLLSTGEGAPLPRLMALLGLEDVARECHVA